MYTKTDISTYTQAQTMISQHTPKPISRHIHRHQQRYLNIHQNRYLDIYTGTNNANYERMEKWLGQHAAVKRVCGVGVYLCAVCVYLSQYIYMKSIFFCIYLCATKSE